MAAAFARLLLATEHGSYDGGAESLALALAQRCGLPLACVLPIVGNPEFETVAPRLAERADAEASLKREQLLAMALAAGVRLTVQVRRGPEPAAEIIEEARLQRADLLVVRRRGPRGVLANLLVGEMVSQVLRSAPCSVLIAPRAAQMWSRRVMVGLDPAAVDVGTLGLAAGLAADCGLPLQVVCVVGNEAARSLAQPALATALQQARAVCRSADGELRVGPVQQELTAAARGCAADLIVIGRQGRDHPGRARIGGVTNKVIGAADGPVLVHVHNAQETTA